jgi:hypothetical protein
VRLSAETIACRASWTATTGRRYLHLLRESLTDTAVQLHAYSCWATISTGRSLRPNAAPSLASCIFLRSDGRACLTKRNAQLICAEQPRTILPATARGGFEAKPAVLCRYVVLVEIEAPVLAEFVA